MNHLSGLPRRDRGQEAAREARRVAAPQDPPGQEPADQHRAQGQLLSQQICLRYYASDSEPKKNRDSVESDLLGPQDVMV